MVLKQPGFTLLEMLIVVAIMGALAAAASPFTQEWYNTAKVNEMIGVLQEGSARAKALALSNANVTQGDNIAALLCPENNILYLYAAPPSACGVAGAVWSSRFPGAPSTTVTLNDNNWTTCIALNSLALPSNVAFEGAACPVQRDMSVARGGTNVSFILY